MPGIAGTIVRIRCRNFLTYESMEVRTHDKLNVIIGPNGTGKSTLACAIVLGLGGKTSVIGRSKQLSAFVQFGQTKAAIEIELNNPNGENYIIRRVFDSKNESKWSINGKQTTENQVKNLVSKLNIQVDNLCQFLPQDRVQDFAKMNKQQLFANTLKSIGGVEMENTTDKLKQLQRTYIDLKRNINSKTKSLDQETIDNQRLEGEVKNSHQRKKLLTRIEHMNSKKLWLQYYDKGKEKEELKKEWTAIKNKYDTENLRIKPLQDNLNAIDVDVKNVQNQIIPLNNKLQQSYAAFMKSKEQCNDIRDQNDLNEDKIKDISREKESIRRDMKSMQLRLSSVQTDADNIDEEELSSQIQQCQHTMRTSEAEGQEVKSCKERLEDNMDAVKQKMNANTRRLQQLENIRYQRETLLSEMSEDAMKATKWLRENAHLFQGQIYEPMLLEINIKKSEFGRHIEHIISRDDLIAFTCEKAEDARTLLKELRENKKWKVNIVTIPDEEKRKSIKGQTYPITYLKKFGFECFASDVIEVPDGIRSYLDFTYQMQSIPLGGKDVMKYHYSSSIPQGINRYYSDAFCYLVFKSQYSGNIISQTNPLKKSCDYFKASSDPEIVRQLKLELKQLSREESNLTAQMNKLEEQIQTLKEAYTEARTIWKEAKRRLEQKRSVDKTSQHIQNQLTDLEKRLVQCGHKETKYKQQIQDNLTKLTEMSKKMPQQLSMYASVAEEVMFLTLTLNQKRKHLEQFESEFQKKAEIVKNIKRTVEEADQRLGVCKLEVKRLYQRAMEKTEQKLPSEEPLRSIFSKFSDHLETLDTEISKQKAELACLPEVDENVFREYETRLKKIESLKESLGELSSELSNTEATVNNIKSAWITQVNTYIGQINHNYGKYFQEMSCAGEVSLHVPEDEYDFENYGITIRVKFREESELKELDGHRQSGGERAVSTALYMLAMQGLTSVPFRLVDEINQGMDAENERKVFQLLLSIVDHSNTSCQYFLITPKLLSNMEYTRDTAVHCIYNGAQSLSHEQFNVNKFIEIAQQYPKEANYVITD